MARITKVACLAAKVTGEAKVRVEDDLTRVRYALAVAKEDGSGLEAKAARLMVEQMRSYWSSRHPEMSCLLFIPKRARIRKPWSKTTRKPWSRFSLMDTDVVRSNMASVVTGQGFQMASLTLPTHFLHSFVRI